MNLETWLVYVGAVFVLTITPGPSVLLCISNGISHGAKRAAFSAFGSVTSVVAIMALSAMGLGAVLAASDTVFQIIKWLGGAYLMYLGFKLLFSRNSPTAANLISASPTSAPKSRWSLYTQGLMVGASNPKALVFFSALFPQFLDPTAAQLPQFAILCSTFVVFESFWLLTYASFASRIAPWLNKRGRQLIFDRACGATFVTAGALLLTIKRNSSA